ncbi:hypothetical protein BWP39_30595 [Paraburkholderia acidicola]|uniref:Uncharacterized protein n=2 Tax=Paraburkholderia acidicola TaxID=1912599 RepID=A0A2A4ET58_9BURK|nr:hypothetical protein BWP39_30595 [Paraburkholderia acidicola]
MEVIMVEKLRWPAASRRAESRPMASKVRKVSGLRAAPSRSHSSTALADPFTSLMRAEGAIRASVSQRGAGRSAPCHGISPALIHELTSIWEHAHTAHAKGGDPVLGDVADQLATIICDCGNDTVPGDVADRIATIIGDCRGALVAASAMPGAMDTSSKGAYPQGSPDLADD